MNVEEDIIQTLKKYREKAISLRDNREKQKQEYKRRNLFLQSAFQQDPQLILRLFWKYYKEWEQLSEQERDNSPRYSDEFFWTITASPSAIAIETACQIMIDSVDFYKEWAASFLGDAMDPTAVPYLIEALKSEDYNVVSKSALALGEIGDSRAEPYLLEIVDKYDNDEVYSNDRLDDAYPIIRHNVFNALCFLNTSAARQKILQSLYHDRDISIQLRAVRYLVAEMPKEAIPYLEELSKNSNEEVATLAKDFLEELNPKH